MKLLNFDLGNILYTMLTMLTILSQSNSVLQPELNYCKKWQHIKPYNNIITVKDKAEVLMQVDQLTQVKDELTEQVKSPWQLLVLNIVSKWEVADTPELP